MSYYRYLDLEREPFSTSPDPAFFYQSDRHRATLANLMITPKEPLESIPAQRVPSPQAKAETPAGLRLRLREQLRGHPGSD